MKEKTGFTLIELLVVIAIIAILAAILFPVFTAARDNARASACLSNQKQVGLALMQYTDDWADSYPYYRARIAYRNYSPSTGWPPRQTHPYGGFHPLARYLKSPKVLMCRSALPGEEPDPHAPYITNLSFNGWGSHGLWGTEYFDGQIMNDRAAKTSEVVCPSRVVNSVEWMYQWYGRPEPGFCWYSKPGTHNGGMNITFADGHARWYSIASMPYDSAANGWVEPPDWPEMKISWRKDYRP